MISKDGPLGLTVPLLAMITVFTLLMGIQYLMLPYLLDDVVHMANLIPYTAGNIYDVLHEMYLHDNIRLVNILFVLMCGILPKCTLDVISVLFTWGMLVMAIKVCGISRRNIVIGYLLTGCMILLLPWGDQIFSSEVFRINYVWPPFFILLWIKYFFSGRRFNCWLAILAIAVGAMHEGASLPLTAGAIWYVTANRASVNWRQYAMIVLLGIGVAVLILAPCTAYRSGEVVHATLLRPATFYLMMLARNGNGLILAMGIMAYGVWSGRMSIHRCISSRFFMFLIAGIVGYLVGIYAPTGNRVMWYPQFYALISCFGYLGLIFPAIRWRGLLVKTVVATACTVQLVTADIYTYFIAREYDEIMRLYDESPDGTVHIKTRWIAQPAPAWLRHKAPTYITTEPYIEFFNRARQMIDGDAYKPLEIVYL